MTVCVKHTTNGIVADYSDEEDNEGCDDEAGEDEASAGSGRVVQTVPAREPRRLLPRRRGAWSRGRRAFGPTGAGRRVSGRREKI